MAHGPTPLTLAARPAAEPLGPLPRARKGPAAEARSSGEQRHRGDCELFISGRRLDFVQLGMRRRAGGEDSRPPLPCPGPGGHRFESYVVFSRYKQGKSISLKKWWLCDSKLHFLSL